MSSLDPIHFILIFFVITCVLSVIAFCATYLKDYPVKAAHRILDKIFSVKTVLTESSESDRKHESKEPVTIAKEQIKQEKFEQAVLTLTEYLKDHPHDKEAHELLEHAVKWS